MVTPARFAVVCPAFQCEAWAQRCLGSIRAQTHRDFRCVYIDDVSADRTFDAARAAVAGDARFTVVRNEERGYPLANIVKGTRLASLDSTDIVVIVDGDDWLKHERVLEHVARVYEDPEVWLTHGSHELLRRPLRDRLRRRPTRGPLSTAYPAPVRQSGLYRYFPFHAGHLRTYRRFLFDAIRDEDLRDEDGRYYWGGGDLATMVPMLEMATARHIRYIPEILYVYNNGHPLAEMRPETRDRKLLVKLKIQARPRYSPLTLSGSSG